MGIHIIGFCGLVSRTHLDIFKYHYPRTLNDWYCDDWISYVYGELNVSQFSKQLVKVQAVHYNQQQRYDVGIANCINLVEETKIGRGAVALYINENFPSVLYSFGQKPPC